MTGRERVRAAMRHERPDRVPVQYYYTPVGYHEHGERLNDLFARLPGDFEPFARKPVPVLPASNFDAQGHYHSYERDEWGTVWERRIFGIAGLPCQYPLGSLERLESYRFPARPAVDLDALRAETRAHQARHYRLCPAGTLLERLRALYPDEDVLCDLALGEKKLEILADRIIDYYAEDVRLAIASGADGIAFGDDYGTERGMLIGPDTWRAFFKPRLKRLFAPAAQAGLDIVFHSCGLITPILPDLREVGATAIWPQLPAYDMDQLARTCRSLGLSVAVHTDRANTMTHGTPEDVRALVLRECETFRMTEGGAWFYAEVDNGFPFENIEALIRSIAEIRGE